MDKDILSRVGDYLDVHDWVKLSQTSQGYYSRMNEYIKAKLESLDIVKKQ